MQSNIEGIEVSGKNGEKLIVQNRRAYFDYEILEKYEAGIELKGTEVKSLRTSGSMSIKDAYVDYEDGELFLVNAYIRPYEQGNIMNHDPERKRKLLMHKREILRLGKKMEEKGLTVIPLRVYFKRGIVKVEIALCKGKKLVDKREEIKKRETQREIEKLMKRFR